jgi:hypothetical protein
MKSMCGALVVSVLAFSSLLDTAAHAGPHQQKAGPLIIEKQGSFFIGGRDIHSSHLGKSRRFPRKARSLSIRSMCNIRFHKTIAAPRWCCCTAAA